MSEPGNRIGAYEGPPRHRPVTALVEPARPRTCLYRALFMLASVLACQFAPAGAAGLPTSLKNYQGRVLVVVFFSGTCLQCALDVPRMQSEIWERFRGKGVQVVAVSNDLTPEKTRAFIKRHRLTFPVLVDQHRKLYSQYAKSRLALYAVILDPNGGTAYSAPEVQWSTMTSTLVRLTKGKS